jgi:ketosteroid isomerase-like protein
MAVKRILHKSEEKRMSIAVAAKTDLDKLKALNVDYINSVQHSDIDRFDQILADDFLCSNPDGSLVNKREFLVQTARPVTITNVSAEDIQIRIFDDVAIIHARTSYSLANGEHRNGRYTDVWAKRNGRWLAVSAHVTR